jgi:3-hydroxymyristoyl/3-hydroxydecanoyl-(acyl carrier protein) dehydratase
MRYRFVDEVVGLELGDAASIEVRKTFEDDDALSGPAGRACVPNSLVLELMATTGGHLLFEYLKAERLPLLVKVQRCEFRGRARPGATLRAPARLLGTAAGADFTTAQVTAEVLDGAESIAAAQLFFLCVPLADVEGGFGDGRE